MKQKKRPRRKKRRWSWLQILSLLTFALVLVFLWMLGVMDREVRRLEIFGREDQRGQQVKPGASSQAEEIEREEKKALEDILREKSEP